MMRSSSLSRGRSYRLVPLVGSLLISCCVYLAGESHGFEPMIPARSFGGSAYPLSRNQHHHHRPVSKTSPPTKQSQPFSNTMIRSNNGDDSLDGLSSSYRRHTAVRPLSASNTNLSDNDDNDEGGGGGIVVNPLYFIPWVGFLVYAFLLSPGNVMDGTDTTIIQSFLADPTNMSGTINPLFFVVFNAIGIMPLVLASIVLPQGKNTGGLWGAAPFLVVSIAVGYFSFGTYMSFRSPPLTTKTQKELSWPTRYIFENKIYNWVVVIMVSSLLFTSGLVTFNDPTTISARPLATVMEDYIQLASTSKLVANSSLDLVILTLCAASLIPYDYRLRYTGDEQQQQQQSTNKISTKAILVAVSTLFVPVVGAALYCAVRPPLPEE